MTEQCALTEKQPESPGQARALGLFLLKRYEEAAAVYDILLKKDPDNIVFWVNRMVCRLQYSSVNTDFFDQMIRRVRFLPSQGYLCLADVLKNMGRQEEALVFINKALDLDSGNLDAYITKTFLLMDLERFDELYDLMRSIYPRLKKDERGLCVAALYASMFWNTRQAEYLLKKALKLNRHAVLQNKLFYSVLLSIGKEEEVSNFGLEALEICEDNPFVWFGLSQAYMSLRDYEAADSAFDTLSRLSGLTESLQIQWMQALTGLQEYERAFDLLTSVFQNSEDWLLQIQDFFYGMQSCGLVEKSCQYAQILRDRYKKSPEVRFICDTVLNKDRNESQPLSLVKLTNDRNASALLTTSSDASYRAPLLLEQVLDLLREPVAGSMHVLDLGCGTGAMGDVLEKYSRPEGSLTGVDISPEVLNLALKQEKYTDLKEEDLVSFCKDKKNAGRYDMVVCMNVLFSFSDLTPVFKSVRSALKDGGTFIFSVLPLAENNLFFRFDSGLFYHNADYIVSRLKSAKFEQEICREGFLYQESDPCLIFAARKKK